ncbi:hypothetical protein SeLEV6574_g00390 [Synchytrium endobioticum]|nr:hypothetical protein SeLEV6574_g00390 [Synchytrium endobioticum]
MEDVLKVSHTDGDSFHLSQTDYVLALLDNSYNEHYRKALDALKAKLKSRGFDFHEIDLSDTKRALAIRCTDDSLAIYAHCSSLTDYLRKIGVPTKNPPSPIKSNLELMTRLTSAERLRLINEILIQPEYEGGLGILEGTGVVECIFPIHDHDTTKKWIQSWSNKWILDTSDLDLIRDYAGSEVALYFCFLQVYFSALIPFSIISTAFWFFGWQYDYIYAFLSILWGIVTCHIWERRARAVSISWRIRGASQFQPIRAAFKPQEFTKDPVTNAILPFYPEWKRLAFIAGVTFPIVLLMVILQGAIISAIYILEQTIKHYYQGPMPQFVVFVPTIIYVSLVPTLSTLYTPLLDKLTDMENQETIAGHHASHSVKSFVFATLTTYLPLAVLGFVFVPFEDMLESVLGSLWHFDKGTWASSYSKGQAGPDVFQQLLIYYTVTGQIENLFTELIVPMVKPRALRLLRMWRSKSCTESPRCDGGPLSPKLPGGTDACLKQIRYQYEKPPYDLDEDLREMVLQFGFIMLFGVAWPLAPVACLINNLLESRCDMLKICFATRRPTPYRAEEIGPYTTILKSITRVSSLTSPALIILYQSWDTSVPATIQTLPKLPLIAMAALISEQLHDILSSLVKEGTKQWLTPEESEFVQMEASIREESKNID